TEGTPRAAARGGGRNLAEGILGKPLPPRRREFFNEHAESAPERLYCPRWPRPAENHCPSHPHLPRELDGSLDARPALQAERQGCQRAPQQAAAHGSCGNSTG